MAGARVARFTVAGGHTMLRSSRRWHSLVRAGPRRPVLRYEVVEWNAPHRLVLVARTASLQSVDEITVESADGGAVVTYDARLDLRGALSIANPLLALAFRRVGDRVAAGLRRALGGEPPVAT